MSLIASFCIKAKWVISFLQNLEKKKGKSLFRQSRGFVQYNACIFLDRIKYNAFNCFFNGDFKRLLD